MDTKVSMKNIYLLLLISIGLIGLGVGSTFAMFTASANIANPISFYSELDASNNMFDTQNVTIPAYSDVIVELDISSTGDSTYNYSSWYISASNILEVVSSTSNNSFNPTGQIDPNDSFTLTVTLRNRTASSIDAVVGVSYKDGNSVYIPTGATIITLGTLPPLINQNASTYITNLYMNNKDGSTITNNTTSYRRASTVSLMNDKKGNISLGADLDSGNIRYYGSNPNNYIYFNCTDYLNQSDATCEKWRIIGVFDNTLKIIRSQTIGNMSWDTSASGTNSGKGSNDWTDADIMKLLNPGYDTNSITVSGDPVLVNNSLYWNRAEGTTNYFSGQSNAYSSNVNFANIGITPATKSKNYIIESTWYTGKLGFLGLNISPATAYKDEREEGSWNGKVGIMYASDYAYATDIDSSVCNRYITNYNNTAACTTNDWLYTGSDEWVLSTAPSSSVSYIASSGAVEHTDMYNVKAIRPAVHISSDIYFWLGTGTINDPYRIR